MTQDQPTFDVVPLPTEVSSAGALFFSAADETMDVFSFIVGAALSIDEFQHIARWALDGKDAATRPKPAPDGPALKRLRQRKQPIYQMLLCRLVDNFSIYLVEIVELVIRQKPELLRSRAQVSIEEVLSFEDLDAFRNHMIQRRVEELGYLGFADLEKWWTERLGLPLVDDAVLAQSVVELLETRNCVVHARCRIGRRYVERCRSALNVGDLRRITFNDVSSAYANLCKLVSTLDQQLAQKFTLARVPCPVKNYHVHAPAEEE